MPLSPYAHRVKEAAVSLVESGKAATWLAPKTILPMEATSMVKNMVLLDV